MENGLAVLLAAFFLVYALSRVKIFIRLHYRRQATDDFIRIDVYALRRLMLYSLDIPVIETVREGGLPWLKTRMNAGGAGTETHTAREQRFAANTLDIYLKDAKKWRHLAHEVHVGLRLYYRCVRRLERKMQCEKFLWRTTVGLDDAAITSMIAGGLWVVKSEFYLFLKRRLRFAVRPVIMVTPSFVAERFAMELECIFTIRVGNVINAVLSLIEFPVKEVKDSG
ncbi:MAG: DUF2953 domain-containing protein [Negativicutes bacterium]|nr:DUF2953 domain-containing protein [Negativicutes bacterium]